MTTFNQSSWKSIQGGDFRQRISQLHLERCGSFGFRVEDELCRHFMQSKREV